MNVLDISDDVVWSWLQPTRQGWPLVCLAVAIGDRPLALVESGGGEVGRRDQAPRTLPFITLGNVVGMRPA